MPELPEVETVARTLREGGQGREPVTGRVITRARLLWQRTLAEPQRTLAEPQRTLAEPQVGEAELSARLAGQAITAVSRRGKFLVLTLDRDTLLIHLRMSGDIRVEPQADAQGQPVALQPHDRLALDFADGGRMAFNDTRKFGRVWLLDDPQRVLGALGPEPLDPQFTAPLLYERLRRVHRQIKPLLLDQSFIAGLGNIYTDEALFAARIYPLRSSDSLTPDEAAALWAAIRAVLTEGIRRNGASIDWAYRGGDFQNHFQVYQRTGQPCPRCGAPIVRITVGQRGTHYCPNCQRREE